MGSSASRSKAAKTQSSRRNRTVYCSKHPRNTVTHFCDSTDELLCLTCHMTRYSSLSRGNSNNETRGVVEVVTYTETMAFNQKEKRAIQTIRKEREELERKAEQALQLSKRIIDKKEKLKREVKEFVDTIISLIGFLEKDLIKRMNLKFKPVQDEVQERIKDIEKDLEKVKRLQTDLENTNDKITLLGNVLEVKTLLCSLADSERRKLPNPKFKLKLNKRITLKQIIGSEEGKSNISLGEVMLDDVENDVESLDISSDVTETEDALYEQWSLGKQANDPYHRPRQNKFMENESSKSSNQMPPSDKKLKQVSENRGDFQRSHNQSSLNRKGSTSQLSFVSSSKEDGSGQVNRSSSTTVYNNNRTPRPRSVQALHCNITPRPFSVQGSLSNRTPRASVQSITTPSGIAIKEPILEGDEDLFHMYLDKITDLDLPTTARNRNITDSVELDDGRLVLCDQKNKELLLFNSSLEHIDTCLFSANPHNITDVTKHKIAITMPEEQFIKIVNVEDDCLVHSDDLLPTAVTKCRGIDQMNGRIYYTWKNNLYAIDGETTRKFERAFKQPVSLLADRNNNTLHVCCRGNKTRGERGEVVTMSADGRILWSLSEDYIKEPVSCTNDGRGRLFVCDIQPPPQIHVVENGRYSHVVLGSTHEKYQHIRFLQRRNVFLISENDSNFIGIYKIRHHQ